MSRATATRFWSDAMPAPMIASRTGSRQRKTGGCTRRVPGSHVVVRNPTRQQELPPATLSEAASLAAYFSYARGATKVNVHLTQVRHVRKPRGAAPGRVILKVARTVLAEPLSPRKMFNGSDQSESTKTEPPTRSGPGAR